MGDDGSLVTSLPESNAGAFLSPAHYAYTILRRKPMIDVETKMTIRNAAPTSHEGSGRCDVQKREKAATGGPLNEHE